MICHALFNYNYTLHSIFKYDSIIINPYGYSGRSAGSCNFSSSEVDGEELATSVSRKGCLLDEIEVSAAF